MDNLGAASQDVEEIDTPLEIGETMMLGLRLAEGVSNRRFESRFQKSLPDVFGYELEKLRDQGLLAWDGSVARLTQRGRLLGNRVFERFI
jgi:oxygen-independent coproporphyrinogen-3 oxidase